MDQTAHPTSCNHEEVTRRTFITSALAAGGTLSGSSLLAAEQAQPAPKPIPPKITRKFKLGVVGCGGRGTFVTRHFKDHGGFEIHAAADYFQDAVDRFGNTYGVDRNRRFTGLSGYRKLIESGVDIVALENLPYFFPEQAAAVIGANKHLYMAKPVAVDVPGTLAIGALGPVARKKNLCFMVDYQAPMDPINGEIRQRILDGALGRLAYVSTYGVAGRWSEPNAKTPREEYLRNSKWLFHVELAADPCVSFDIHAIDTAIWVLNRRPIAAMGYSARVRPDAFLSGRDVVQGVLQFQDGLVWTHQHQSLANQSELSGSSFLCCKVYGTEACAVLPYEGKAFIRGGKRAFDGNVSNTYPAGVIRNVAQYYKDLTEGHFENPTVARSIDSHLASLLLREAAYRQGRLTMEELLKENKQLRFDTTGLRQ